MLDGAVADVSRLAVPADVQSLGTGQENIDLRSTGDDVQCLAAVVAAGRSTAEQFSDLADNAGIAGGDEPGSKHARAAIEHTAVAEAANRHSGRVRVIWALRA